MAFEVTDELTILRCNKCGWTSKELAATEVWYPHCCFECGERNIHFIKFKPHERKIARLLTSS